MSSTNILELNQPKQGVELFKKAFIQQITCNKGISDLIDDKNSIYDSQYKDDMKVENRAQRKLKFKVGGHGDCAVSHDSDDSQVHKKKKPEKEESDKVSDVHFSEDDEIDKKFVIKLVNKEITKVKRKLAICYDRIDGLQVKNKENLEKFIKITGNLDNYEGRMNLCEKSLKFTNIMKPTLDAYDQEASFRDLLDEQMKPTMARTLELQTKMGYLQE